MKFEDLNIRGTRRHKLCKFAHKVPIIFYLIAVIELFMTVFIPLSEESKAFEIYSRNYSNVVCLIFLGYYFDQLGYYFSKKEHSIRNMKKIKILSLIAAVACFLKVIISIVLCLENMSIENMIYFFYICELTAWGMLGVFFSMIYKNIKLQRDIH